MTRAQREVLEQRICNFYCDAAKKSVKTTGNYFKKQNTVYYILKKYLRYGTTKDLPRNGRPVKLSTKDLLNLSTIDVLEVNVTISSASIDYFPSSSTANIGYYTKT